jgi:hypothetical protein
MEIQTLKLFLAEEEINNLLPRVLPADVPIEDFRIQLMPEGVVVRGEYPTMLLKVPFETLWEVSAVNGRLRATLASVKVAGLAAGMLRGVLLKMIRDVAAQEAGVQVQDESVTVDVERILAAQGVELRVHITAVRSSLHSLVIEAGPG